MADSKKLSFAKICKNFTEFIDAKGIDVAREAREAVRQHCKPLAVS